MGLNGLELLNFCHMNPARSYIIKALPATIKALSSIYMYHIRTWYEIKEIKEKRLAKSVYVTLPNRNW